MLEDEQSSTAMFNLPIEVKERDVECLFNPTLGMNC